MLDKVKSGSDCGACAERNPKFVQCRHGGPFKITHNGENFEKCRFAGFSFALDKKSEREIIRKWIELELEAS